MLTPTETDEIWISFLSNFITPIFLFSSIQFNSIFFPNWPNILSNQRKSHFHNSVFSSICRFFSASFPPNFVEDGCVLPFSSTLQKNFVYQWTSRLFYSSSSDFPLNSLNYCLLPFLISCCTVSIDFGVFQLVCLLCLFCFWFGC